MGIGELESRLSKGGRRIAVAVMAAGALYAAWVTVSETGPARWPAAWQANPFGRYSADLVGLLLLIPAAVAGFAAGFLWDGATGQGLFTRGGTHPREIRIIDVPPGEAPEEVRRAWVGLVLPLAGRMRGPLLARSFGVLTGRTQTVHGYAVPAGRAVEILSRHAPEAARWWTSSVPQLLGPRRLFIFHAEVCREV
jgi:hypothetical protein